MGSNIFENHHTTVVGMTGTGKSYMVVHELDRLDAPVLFFNANGLRLAAEYGVSSFVQAGKAYDTDDIIDMLHEGGKINYIPSLSVKYARYELSYLVHTLFTSDKFRKRPVYVAVDEAHLIAPQGGNNGGLLQVPTRGRGFGIFGVFISQRPALVDKTLISQCSKSVVFHTEWADKEYFRTKGLDIDSINERLGKGPGTEHNYVIVEQDRVDGPFKEGK